MTIWVCLPGYCAEVWRPSLLTALVVPLLAASQVVLTAYATGPQRSQVIVVLGETASGPEPSPVYRARLERAAQLWRDGVAPVVATLGGRAPGARTSEAAVGRAWLVVHGLPKSRVLVVPRGADTLASLTALAGVMHDLGWESATLVSDPAQLARVRSMAVSLGLDADVAPSRDGPGSGSDG